MLPIKPCIIVYGSIKAGVLNIKSSSPFFASLPHHSHKAGGKNKQCVEII